MPRFAIRATLVTFFCALFSFSLAAQGWQHIGKVTRVTKLPDGVELTAGKAKVRITAFSDSVVRVRATQNGTFAKDFSWAVVASPKPPQVSVQDSADQIKLTAGTVTVRIRKSPLLVEFLDAAGNSILADSADLPMGWNGSRVHVWKKMPADENYFGLGDKAGPMNRRDRAFVNWNTDAYGWQESTDPLYKTIPFFIGLRKGSAYGLFFDNTYRSTFDFGRESQDFYSFGADGGEINYYFFAGPDPKQIVQTYTTMTGLPPLPPLWSLGFQQSRYSYETETRAREVVKRLRDDKIPADAIYFDIDFQVGNAPFTIDPQKFPHFAEMVSDFSKIGMHTIVITDLHIKKDPDRGYAPYDTGVKNDVFIKRPDGSTYVGVVWPGDSVFPDYTLSRVREWWGTLYKPFVDMGVSGFWNDMNEPAIFNVASKTMPLDNVHRLDDGTSLPHTAIHNVLGLNNVRASYEGLRKLRPEERPFVLTRAAYSGAQRYAATWTGDNTSSWNHLKMSTPMLLSMGISGYGMVGDDIGGFVGSPTPDLLTRWIEVGAFNPVFRDHTGKGTLDQEPWVHGPEHEAIRRRYIEERYKLMPYIYTAIEEMSRTGIPLMRPLFLEYPKVEGVSGADSDFLLGHDILVSPVTTELLDPHIVSLPPGDWYDYWTATKYSAGQPLTLQPTLAEMPVFVRAGAILPLQPLVQYTGEIPDGPLQLRVYPGSDCKGTLYQDDGHTFAFQKGEFLRMNYSCTVASSSVTVLSHAETAAFQPWWSSAEVTVYGAAKLPSSVSLAGTQQHSWRYDEKLHAVIVTVPEARKDWTLQITY